MISPASALRALVAPLVTIGLVAAAPAARAEEPLYLGQRSHLRVDLGSAVFMEEGADAFGLSPVVSGRVALSEAYGLALTLPLTYLSIGDTSRFAVGNPALAFELVDDARDYKRAVLRFGVSLPVASVSDDDLGDALADLLAYSAAAASRGNVDTWLWASETLGLFAEFHTTAFLVELWADLRFSLAGLVPTGDGDFDLLLQSVMRFGYDGGTVIPFGGLTLAWAPTSDGDAFQSGLQLGAIVNLGGPSVDVALQVNLDDPAGFSFDDGILGLHLGVTAPF